MSTQAGVVWDVAGVLGCEEEIYLCLRCGEKKEKVAEKDWVVDLRHGWFFLVDVKGQSTGC